MLNERIRLLRKKKRLTQEELAVRIPVVRQTVSKWEQGLSVPDADQLIRVAEILEVPVSELLEMGAQKEEKGSLAEELANVNEELAETRQRMEQLRRVGEKRGLLMAWTVGALLAALILPEKWKALGMGVCAAAALVVLWRNMTLLTNVIAPKERGVLRGMTLFSGLILAAAMVLAWLAQNGKLTEKVGILAAMGLVSLIMVGFGAVASRLPFNRNVGLRLPWTVSDEETWNVAHRIAGVVSWPLVILYWAVAAANIADLGVVSGCVILAWIAIPGVLSYIYYWRKMNGR